jgi:hypothetical protein
MAKPVFRKKTEHRYSGKARSFQARPHAKPKPRSEWLVCVCGCGEKFIPKRNNQTHVNGKHRERSSGQRWPTVRIPAALVELVCALRNTDPLTLNRITEMLMGGGLVQSPDVQLPKSLDAPEASL